VCFTHVGIISAAFINYPPKTYSILSPTFILLAPIWCGSIYILLSHCQNDGKALIKLLNEFLYISGISCNLTNNRWRSRGRGRGLLSTKSIYVSLYFFESWVILLKWNPGHFLMKGLILPQYLKAGFQGSYMLLCWLNNIAIMNITAFDCSRYKPLSQIEAWLIIAGSLEL
jgi:hypothetical protein